jgi:uncharacterized protein YjeT (DUF2065 family)
MNILAFALAALFAFNGLYMLAMPDAWYATVPGVVETGPANHHFIRDIGLAYLAAGCATVLGALGGGWRLFAVAAIFIGGHAIFHVVEYFTGHPPSHLVEDLVFIHLPGVALIFLALRSRAQAKE